MWRLDRVRRTCLFSARDTGSARPPAPEDAFRIARGPFLAALRPW